MNLFVASRGKKVRTIIVIVCMKFMVSVVSYVKANVRIVIREFPPYFTQKWLKDEDF